MNDNSQVVDLSTLCRVCLEEAPRLYPLAGPIVNVDLEVATMITYCTGEKIELSEDLPNGVCLSCFRTIRIAYNFISEFKETNKQLLGLRESTKKKQEQLQEISTDNDMLISEVEEAESFNPDENEDEIYSDVIKSEIDINIEEILNDLSDESQINAIKLENEPGLSETQSPTRRKKAEKKCYQCPICWKTVSRFNAVFLPHLYSHKDEQFVCSMCELGSKLDLENYVRHYKKCHLYQCQICYKSLNNKGSYSYHMKNHMEEKPYICSYGNCKKTFARSGGLKKHVITHTNTAGYICSKCGKTCNTYDTFRYHLKTHDGKRNFLCTVCGRAFLQSVHLKYHMWKHTGVKQFQCKKCNKSYTAVTQLKKHLRKYCGVEETKIITETD